MWSKIAALYRAIDEEQCKVLADPRTLEQVAPGYRRVMAAKLAAMGPMERARLLAFSVKYRGKHLCATLVGIMLVSTLCGLLASMLFPNVELVKHLVVANLIGMGLVCWLAGFYFGVFGKPSRAAWTLIGCIAMGMVAGAVSGGWQQGFSFKQSMTQKLMPMVVFICVMGLLIAVQVALMSAIRNRQYKAYNAKLELEAERHRAARELSESRLRLLHAQIEPHFLFNTLGAVQQLAEKNAPDAARLTASLIAFLRASLDEMRSETVSLRADFAMVEAYLQVMKARLGGRLEYTLDLPEALSQVTIPSMMLLTLVENAIKHGIEPSLRGGHISVAAAAEGASLKLTVRDSGPGLGSAPGIGEGLANVQARLQLLHADAAGLTIADQDEGGLVAAIVLPLEKETT